MEHGRLLCCMHTHTCLFTHYRCHLRAGLEVIAPALHTLRVRCRDPPNSDQLTHLRIVPFADDGTDTAILRRPRLDMDADLAELPSSIDVKLFANVGEQGLDAATLQHLRSHPRVTLVVYLQPVDMWGEPDAWL